MCVCVCAGIFIAFGLGGVIPSMHVLWQHGLYSALHNFSLGWLAIMAFLYISGALIYAFRIPERIFPGKFDIWVCRIFNLYKFAYSSRFSFILFFSNKSKFLYFP